MATWVDVEEGAGVHGPRLPALKASFAAASGLVLFDKALSDFLKRVDGADTRIGRMDPHLMAAPQKNRSMTRFGACAIQFHGFFRSAAAHGVTQKPTLLTNRAFRRHWQ